MVEEVQLVVFKCEGTECRSPAHIKTFVLLIFFEIMLNESVLFK